MVMKFMMVMRMGTSNDDHDYNGNYILNVKLEMIMMIT